MSSVFIVDTAVVTSLGSGVDSLFQRLLDSETAISPVKRFETRRYTSQYAALIPWLEKNNEKSLIFKLTDLLLDQMGEIDKETFLLTASTKAGIDLLEKENSYKDGLPKDILPSSLSAYISRRMGLAHGGININSACASSTIAVAKAADIIRSGRVHSVLVCCMDIVTEFVFSGFSALTAMSDRPCAPFDRKRNGLTLGEGAAAILLMNKSRMSLEKRNPLAEISGWGIANDAVHLTAPAKDSRGLKMAIKKALKSAGIPPEKIGAVSAHGTGTIYNDLMEIKVIRSLFNPKAIAANSIKGAIGHTLGAAGGIEIALCAKMLEQKILPGTKGLAEPEAGAEKIFSPEAMPILNGCILTINSGFGGANAAVIIKRT